MGRRQAREGTMKLLYQMEINSDFSDEALTLFLDNFDFDQSESEYINHAIETIRERLTSIDEIIKKYLEGWEITRIAKIDLAILRIAIYEILYRKDIPVQVSINEAIESSKKYSNVDSFRFINGVLGGVVRSMEEEES